MATQEPVTLSQEDLERIATFLREGGGVRRGRPQRKPEPVVLDELEPDPVAEADPLIRALTKEREVRGLSLETVAKRMEVTVDKLQLLESGALDGRLSTLRNWSQAVFMEITVRSTKPGRGRIRYNRR